MNSWNLSGLNRWVNRSSLKALEDAYQGALAIKKIEDTHFEGRAIINQPDKGKTVSDYFQTQLDRQLLRIRSSLLRFRTTSFLVSGSSSTTPTRIEPQDTRFEITLSEQTNEAIILEKLAFIESVVGKYRNSKQSFSKFFSNIFSDPVPTVTPEVLNTENVAPPQEQPPLADEDAGIIRPATTPKIVQTKGKTTKNNQSPYALRLFGGAAKIGKEFSPKYEQEVIQELRVVRAQNRTAVRWIVLLLVIPIITQILTKNLLLNPLLGNYFEQNPTKVELSKEIQEEFIHEFSSFRETLEIKRLIAKAIVEEEKEGHKTYINTPKEEAELASALFGEIPPELVEDLVNQQPGQFKSLLLTTGWTEVEQELEEKALQEKVLDLWREARQEQLEGIKNVLADCAALLAFITLVYFGRQRLAHVRSFSNRAFLNLNDPSKVFLFILITDMFVGFHSAEGWEIILEGLSHRFGIPESRIIIYGFIATVPVLIDSWIKFWIFNYLTRFSPAASAIYERMNT